MKIFKTSQVREADAYTIKNEPISSINLMERAAKRCYKKIISDFKNQKNFVIIAGQGNNGGDGLVIARYLKKNKYNVRVFILKLSDKFSDDCKTNIENLLKLKNVKINFIENENDFPDVSDNEIIIDALFGSGLSRPLTKLPAKLVNYLNNSQAKIISIDVPSGLFGEDNSDNLSENIIKSYKTYTFQFPKLSFLIADNADFVNNFEVIDIGVHKDYINNTDADFYYINKETVKEIKKTRKKFTHKGTYGHSLLISGSYGKMGAAILAGKACLRAGCGLLTSVIPKFAYDIYQTALPEAMVKVYENNLFDYVFDEIKNYNAVAIGPGIGINQTAKELFTKLIGNYKKPIVFDADALNILSQNKNLFKNIPENSILTPHPKEFDRLFGESNSFYDRFLKQQKISKELKIIIVLKGAHTSISLPNEKVYFNSSGNSGMATAGSGDVLTGIILGLLSQKYTPVEAALFGVYLHGLAGDIYAKKQSKESLIASDIIRHIANAYKTI